ncbi:MAG TPA: hypothetical protein PKE30_10505 [Niabella sp.]|nr:hypothetical protein [Niabella sp.]
MKNCRIVKPVLIIAMLLLPALLLGQTQAQVTAEQRIQDSVIGWWSNNYWDRQWRTPANAREKVIETHVNKMVEWMKASYTPVGGLGTVTRYKNKKGFGVNFMVWNVSHDKMWTDEKGNFKPISEENTKFFMAANKIFGAYEVEFLSNDNQFVFTWPDDGFQKYHPGDKDERPAGIHPNVSKFITVRNEMQNIILAPGNKLPFVTLTKGELLQLSDAALATGYAKADDFNKKAITRIRGSIAALQKKHAGSLNEQALIGSMQPIMYMFDGADPFELTQRQYDIKQYYKVYKFPPALMAKLGDPQPQWISIALPFKTKESGNQLYEMYTAITQNINYDYIYNYFFAPEKVKGKVYTPANADQLQVRLEGYHRKYREGLTAKPREPNSHAKGDAWFTDNFLSNTAGGSPKNWYFATKSEHTVIATPKNENGNWLQLGLYNPVRPNLMPYPLPKDFAINFDLVTDGGFTGRTGGSAMLTLNSRKPTERGTENDEGNGELLTINFVSGNPADFDNKNYRGEIDIDLHSKPARNVQHNNEGAEAKVSLTAFSGMTRKIHVTVKVKSGVITVLVNGKEMSNSRDYKLKYGAPCMGCGFNASTRIHAISWKATTGENAGKIKVYVGNVVVTKL